MSPTNSSFMSGAVRHACDSPDESPQYSLADAEVSNLTKAPLRSQPRIRCALHARKAVAPWPSA